MTISAPQTGVNYFRTREKFLMNMERKEPRRSRAGGEQRGVGPVSLSTYSVILSWANPEIIGQLNIFTNEEAMSQDSERYWVAEILTFP